MTTVPNLTLNDGRLIPQLGYGVLFVPPEQTAEAVTMALAAGYRLIDTAQGYQNEEGVGEALRRSELPRDEVFITTKLTNSEQGTDQARRAFEESQPRSAYARTSTSSTSPSMRTRCGN